MKTLTLRNLADLLILTALTALTLIALNPRAALAQTQACGAVSLTRAVDGDIWQGYGEADPLALSPLKSRGEVVLARAGAYVSAPANALVEYAGPVSNMGQVVVLNIGNDYRVVLTGMSQLVIRTGDVVRTGARIGAMPSGRQPSHLYMELRCGEEPVDPHAAAATQVAMQ